eukprot:3624746-Pyramimonas_sp.AAC.1
MFYIVDRFRFRNRLMPCSRIEIRHCVPVAKSRLYTAHFVEVAIRSRSVAKRLCAAPFGS